MKKNLPFIFTIISLIFVIQDTTACSSQAGSISSSQANAKFCFEGEESISIDITYTTPPVSSDGYIIIFVDDATGIIDHYAFAGYISSSQTVNMTIPNYVLPGNYKIYGTNLDANDPDLFSLYPGSNIIGTNFSDWVTNVERQGGISYSGDICGDVTTSFVPIEIVGYDANFTYDFINGGYYAYDVTDVDPSVQFAPTGGVFASTPLGLSIDENTGQIDLGMSLPGSYTITYSVTYTVGGVTCTNTHVNLFDVRADVQETTPGCNSYAISASGNDWIPIYTSGGDIVASINPNGVDLGILTIQMDDMGSTVPQDSEGLYFLPRYFNLSSSNYTGISNTFPLSVSVRLYFTYAELYDYNTSTGSSAGINDLNISHYAGNNEDCSIGNNDGYDGSNVEFITPSSASNLNPTSFYLEFELDHFSETGVSEAAQGPVGLPVELNYFNVKRDKDKATLEWETVSEENNRGFWVERSNDGAYFDKIAWIGGHGNSTAVHTYNYTDEKPYSGINYYRLIQEDFDGNVSRSDIKKIQFDTPSIKVFPTLVTNMIQISVRGDFQEIPYTIISMDGTKMKEGSLSSGDSNIDTGNLVSGMYLVSLILDGELNTFKFIKR